MAVPMSPVVWSKTSSLDHAGLEEYKKNTRLSFEERLQSNQSFLYSTVIRRSIEESRTAFLNLSLAEAEEEELETINEPQEVKEVPDHEDKPRRPPCKRISYKIKRSSSVYKKAKAPIKGSLVAELTSKFDMMIAEKKNILSDPKFARLVRRVNSQKLQPGDSIKLHKKPSVKMKFDEKPSFVTKKPSIVRKVSVKQLQKTPSLEKNCIRAKITHLPDETDSKGTNVKPEVLKRSSNVNVKATIERFEKCKSDIPKTLNIPKEKPKVPEKKFTAKTMDIISKNNTKKFRVKIEKEVDQKVERKAEIIEEVPVINIPITKPKSSTEIFICESKPEPDLRTSHSESDLSDFKPNTSFLWRNNDKSPTQLRPTFEEDDYDVVNPPPEEPKQKIQPPIPPRPFELKKVKPKMPEPEKDYEELPEHCEVRIHSYEYFKPPPNYEDIEQREDDGYEAVNPRDIEKKENIYEVLPCRQDNPPPLPRRQEELSPPALPSKNSLYSTKQEVISNGYESIGSAIRFRLTCDDESSYEVLSHVEWGSGSNRDSVVSSDQQSNSLYGRSIPSWTEDVLNYKTTSVSSSDRSDEWEDLPDEDDKIEPGFILVREKPKISKKTSGWSQQLREQWTKTNSEIDDTGSYHHYESVRNAHNESHYDSDSFDSDSDYYDNKPNMHDSGVDMGNTQLPEPPNNQPYVFTRLASAGKRMKRLLTKNDITKSLSRMTKRKSRTDLDDLDKSNKEEKSPSLDKRSKSRSSIKLDVESPISKDVSAQEVGYQNVPYGRNSTSSTDTTNEAIYEKQKNKKGFLTKFRRSMSLTAESANELTQELTNKPKSTFYLTGPIDIDEQEVNNCDNRKSSVPATPAKIKYAKPVLVRPQVPPPPLPTHHSNIELRIPNDNDAKRTTSWYAECGLFKNDMPLPNLPKRPNTCWYAEVGLYQAGPLSTPSTSSAENSGTSSNFKSDFILTSAEEYYNFRNDNTYYNDSICSITSNESKPDKNYAHISGEMQQLLQDEPLYQLYDAALSESYCKGETLDLDYEEVSNEVTADSQLRPSAMELILKNGNSVSITRSLWCEIPEVKNSAVLSTLSLPQKKLQEAKFEMMTSEASYLNSLNVLNSHFIKNLRMEDCLTDDESHLIFGQIPSVKNCSEKLLQDMEKCWQDNILLHNICDVIQKHAEENFDVYVQYCENQILLDSTLKKLKDKPGFNDSLLQLETSTTCQALTLYSFLMLPMQRITRWPLLLDAVLKRLSVDDKEYGTCQQALATINKIVKQCNEAARQKERQTEMLALNSRIHFGKHSSLVNLISDHRYLVKSGPVTQMVTRGDDAKLTFGKRFTKLPLHLFLFNDLFLVTKYRANEDNYTVIHHCQRSFVDVNVDVAPSISIKDTQGRHLIFLTILENQDEKLVEMLLSCNTDSDKERWISALSPKISQDPEETLYERWDCPQVTAIHDYLANQPDELSLCRGDIIYVNRKMADGWYHGEKIRDGECGWFPSNYVQEIANPHVRARNLRQRYRLLAFSENYLKTKGQNEHL